MARAETVYLAAPGFVAELREELGEVETVIERLVIARGPPRAAAWAQNTWLEPERIAITSIGDGVRALRARQRRWALHSVALHRRAQLIAAQLPALRAGPLRFGEPLPDAPLGAFTLLEPGLILASPRCSSPVPDGELRFVEDREGPPGRAYLKLWEALTLLGERPRPGDRCLDLGASPGAWSFVLQGLGARVLAVDKAPLAPEVARLERVEHRRVSAFALSPEAIGPIDWLFSDVVCYPRRLLSLVERWLASGLCPRLVCTIKLQGQTDHDAVRAFAAIPGSRVVHLHHNKHELTWLHVPERA
jgi:23S rRNA (cytidine2498-2'-O)-methyltransferase